MTETEALLEIAGAIKVLAASIGSISTVMWLTLLFKNQSGDNRSAIKDLADAIRGYYNQNNWRK